MATHKNIKILPWAYQVVIVREGQEYSRSFKFSDGKHKALKAAIKYRDQLLKILPVLFPYRLVALSNTGIVGVSRCRHTDHRKSDDPVYISYSVRYTDDNNKNAYKSYYIGREEYISDHQDCQGLKKAVAFRKQWERSVLRSFTNDG